MTSGDDDRSARLARAAAALAEAEEVAGLRPGGPAEPDGAGDHPVGGASAAASADPVRDDGPLIEPALTVADEPEGGADEAAPTAGLSWPGGTEDPEAVARGVVLRQLSMAPRSRAQLEKKLRQKGCDDAVAARVLDRFTAVGLIDDEAYAEMFVRSKQSDRGLARTALAHELRKHGIDPEIATGALSQVGAGDERVRAEQLAAKKMRTMHGLERNVQARRLAGMLARKGYSGEIAWPVIRDALDAAEEHQRD